MMDISSHCQHFERSLLTLDRGGAQELLATLARGEAGLDAASELVIQTLKKIGDDWERGTLSLSQVYMSGVICEELMTGLMPPVTAERRASQPRMGIAVFEDFHLLGKRIIHSTLRAAGYEVMDLGNGQRIADLVRSVHEQQIEILLLSVLMLPSALRISQLRRELAGTPTRLVVGGAPFRLDPQLWREVGADATGRNPGEALAIIRGLTEGRP